MKIIRHDAYIAKRRRNSKLIALVGFLLLTGTLFLALNPRLILISYLLMLGGFVLFNIGMQQVGKWSRNPRNDQMIDQHLKALPDRYAIVHYAEVGKRRIEHILVHPGGALALTAKEIDGEIHQRQQRWRRKSAGLRRFFTFSGPQLGNPSVETDRDVAELERFLESHQLEVEVEGAIAFVHPAVELHIEEPDYPVLHGDELAGFVGTLPADESFTAREREQLVGLLKGSEVVNAPVATGRRRPVKRRAA